MDKKYVANRLRVLSKMILAAPHTFEGLLKFLKEKLKNDDRWGIKGAIIYTGRPIYNPASSPLSGICRLYILRHLKKHGTLADGFSIKDIDPDLLSLENRKTIKSFIVLKAIYLLNDGCFDSDIAENIITIYNGLSEEGKSRFLKGLSDEERETFLKELPSGNVQFTILQHLIDSSKGFPERIFKNKSYFWK